VVANPDVVVATLDRSSNKGATLLRRFNEPFRIAHCWSRRRTRMRSMFFHCWRQARRISVASVARFRRIAASEASSANQPGTSALVERLKQDIGLKQIIAESAQFWKGRCPYRDSRDATPLC